jgi:hypothetical protein
MLATKTYELSRDEVVELIEEKAQRLGVDAARTIADFRAGQKVDFGRVVDILALADLLEDDDPFLA